MPCLAAYVTTRLRRFGAKSRSRDRIRLLVLNDHRFRPDLMELQDHPDIELLILPPSLQARINWIFLNRLAAHFENPGWALVYAFTRAEDPEIRESREALYRYLCRFLPHLARIGRLDGIASCSFSYLGDLDWQRAGRAAGVPFFALHKENMKDEAIHGMIIRRYRDAGYRFTGDRLFLFNAMERFVVRETGICPDERISIVGGLRTDRLHRRVERGECLAPGRQVVLFSFHHAVGLFKINEGGGFFSDDPEIGFVSYFDLVHGEIGRLAQQHPDIRFVIKPKWANHWIERIEDAIRRVAGVDPDSLPNLEITATANAQELIEGSSVVVGINSTTLLEAKLIGRRVVVPLFAEAAGKYYDGHVYFKKYMDTFRVAKSPEELGEAILAQLDGSEPAPPPIPQGMVEDFLGYFDGKVRERVVAIMKQDIAAARARRGW